MTTVVSWPHGHLAHALMVWLQAQVTAASTRVYTHMPKEGSRVYPLITVTEAGLGALGMDSAIQADEIRVQVDHWAERKDQVMSLSAEIFHLLDARFPAALKDTTLSTVDGVTPTKYYQTKIEWVHRAGGGDAFLDEFARKWRTTTYYTVKVNL
jgi:hypothetical protein